MSKATTGISSSAVRERLLEAGRSRIFDEAEALRLIGDSLDESFVAAVRLIRMAEGKVVTVGVGTSGPVARRMAHLLSTTGTPSLFLHPGDALHGGLGAITAADVVLAISKGGGSAELNEFIRLAKTRGAALLVLTASADSPLARAADVAVVLPQTPDSDPGGIIAMGSNLAAAAWGDALAIVLMQISGYSWDQVIDAHPSGAVGQREQLPVALSRLPDPAAPPGSHR
ncbi:MAG TPA: SIS domain-containing protein [Propionibacteriaceae bacterium]